MESIDELSRQLPKNYILEKVEAIGKKEVGGECLQFKKDFIVLRQEGVIVLAQPKEKFSMEKVKETISQIEAVN